MLLLQLYNRHCGYTTGLLTKGHYWNTFYRVITARAAYSAFLWDDQGHSKYGASMDLSDNGSLILIRTMPKKRTRINYKLQKNLFLHVNKCQEIQYSHTVHPQLKPENVT